MWACVNAGNFRAEVRPSLEILCSDKKTDCERERERKRRVCFSAFLLLPKNGKLLHTVPQICPRLCSKTHTHTHTHKPPLTAPRPLHRKWFDWVRSTWWRYHLAPCLAVETCCAQGIHMSLYMWQPIHQCFPVQTLAHSSVLLLHGDCVNLVFSVVYVQCNQSEMRLTS